MCAAGRFGPAGILKQTDPRYEQFGISVGVSDDTLLIGTDPGGSGPAYVFARSGTAWSQQAMLRPAIQYGDDFFGNAVAISGGTIVIGAYGEASTSTGINSTPTGFASYSGAAFVFVRNGTDWRQ
jgi:hypothetical protein